MKFLLGPDEAAALAFIGTLHPAHSMHVEPFRDEADVGWLSVEVHGVTGKGDRASSKPFTAYYVVSPTGRVWRALKRHRLNEIRHSSNPQ